MTTVNLQKLLGLPHDVAMWVDRSVVEAVFSEYPEDSILELLNDCGESPGTVFYAGYVLGRLTGQRNPAMD